LDELVAALPPAPRIDFSERVDELPEKLRPLAQFFRAWALSDDLDRSEKIRKASRKQREAVCVAVQPLFADINAYLDSLGSGRWPKAAYRLRCLAECVSEILIYAAPSSRKSDKGA
jgi:hypothetical protein